MASHHQHQRNSITQNAGLNVIKGSGVALKNSGAKLGKVTSKTLQSTTQIAGKTLQSTTQIAGKSGYVLQKGVMGTTQLATKVGVTALAQSTDVLKTASGAKKRTKKRRDDRAAKLSKDNLFDMALSVKGAVKVKDRVYHSRQYPKVFVGSEAIDFLAAHLKVSRDDAVDMAHRVNLAVNAWEHCSEPDTPLIDDSHQYYRFTNFEDAYCQQKAANLEDVMRAFQRGVPVENKKYRLKTYKKVFVGSNAVDFLVAHKYAANRKAAVELGRKIASQYGLFTHVTNDYPLMDEYYFYRMLAPKIKDDANSNKKEQLVEKELVRAWFAGMTTIAFIIYYLFY